LTPEDEAGVKTSCGARSVDVETAVGREDSSESDGTEEMVWMDV
jgi:hypothetical protein